MNRFPHFPRKPAPESLTRAMRRIIREARIHQEAERLKRQAVVDLIRWGVMTSLAIGLAMTPMLITLVGAYLEGW